MESLKWYTYSKCYGSVPRSARSQRLRGWRSRFHACACDPRVLRERHYEKWKCKSKRRRELARGEETRSRCSAAVVTQSHRYRLIPRVLHLRHSCFLLQRIREIRFRPGVYQVGVRIYACTRRARLPADLLRALSRGRIAAVSRESLRSVANSSRIMQS